MLSKNYKKMKTCRFCNPVVRRDSKCTPNSMFVNIPVEKPDLEIYSQQKLWKKHLLLSYDSPDIMTYTYWNNTATIGVGYQSKVHASIRNISNGTATGALIHCDISPFGIGTPRTRLGTQIISVKPSAEITISYLLPPEIIDANQPFGAHITIDLQGDMDLSNNNGSQVVKGVYSSNLAERESEGSRTYLTQFPIHNNTNSNIVWNLATLQNELNAIIEPQNVSLAPGEEVTASLRCRVATDLHGGADNIIKLEATVICTDNNSNLIGGLTFFVFVND